MTSAQLRRRAEARGVTTAYRDWQGRRIQVGDETLQAVLAALGSAPPPAHPPTGASGRPAMAAPWHPADHPAAPAVPRSCWGFTVQLYSVRSRLSWGHGDLRDLADLAAWSAGALGAGFVLINPLHAAEPVPPLSPSPYLPMSRRFLSPLYLRVEDIPEYPLLPPEQRQQIAALAAPLRARNSTSALIDRDAVWTAKRAALDAIRRVPLSPARQASLDEFKIRQGPALQDWGTWCAIAEVHGPDYRSWPRYLRDPRSAEVATARGELIRHAEFHVWVQWLVAQQIAAASRAAREAGMQIGVMHDLAVGAHPGGADAWAGQDVYVRGVSVGAPPDGFNQRGQDWTLPPFHPGHLAAQGYQPLADLIAANLGATAVGVAAQPSHVGLRIDHVMGLSRLWWIPAGMSPDQGAYVRYDHKAMLGVVATQAARASAVVVGEDLGTVEPWLRDALAAHGVLGTAMLWFEVGAHGAPLPPQRWRRGVLATVSTHDMPPAAAFLTGEQVTERALLGLLTRPEREERAESDRLVASWLRALAREGLLAADRRPDPDEFTAALYGYLARTPALLVGVSLAEAVGERRAQNIPGTTTEYPNWRHPLCDPSGTPVLLEDLPDVTTLRAVVQAVSGN